jgi:hypothetical protein
VERQTHFQIPTSTDEAEVDDVLSMLAGESSDSACTESMTIAIGQGLGEDEGVQSPESVLRKRSRRMSHPVTHAEGKKRKKRLRRSSGLELDADPTTSILDGGPTSTVGGLHLPKVLKNTTNMFSKYNTVTGTFGLEMKVRTV